MTNFKHNCYYKLIPLAFQAAGSPQHFCKRPWLLTPAISAGFCEAKIEPVSEKTLQESLTDTSKVSKNS